MPVEESSINNIMSGIENTGGVKQHNHKKKLKQRFDIIRKLGQGTFGKVQLGINKETGQEVAIKTIKKSKIESEADLIRIRREIQIMSSVQHPNIIHIYEVFENREKMVLVMEYAAGGELYDYLSEQKVLPEDEARRIFRQIATASYYCHKHKICHRDLKLENILLDENNNAKIADFGLSNVFDDQRLLNTFCGSPLYASPEIVKGTPYHGPEVDCWSLGVLLYTLVYGAMPFDGSNFKRLVKQISQGDYFEPETPSPASPLIREMLTVNPKNRAGIERICTHWWVNETYDVSCLDISEELANQTPVRLDVLLSLAPPPPQLESDKLVVTGDVNEDGKAVENSAPARSQSVGSIMDVSHPAEKRIKDMMLDDRLSPKRKLENTVSTDRANLDTRKEKIVKENTVADITVHGTIQEDETMTTEAPPLIKSLTQTIAKEVLKEEKEMDVVEEPTVKPDLSLEGAACTEILEEVKKQNNKIKKNLSTVTGVTVLEGINEIPSQENLDKENVKEEDVKEKNEEKTETKVVKRKIPKKKVLGDKNDNTKTKIPVEKEEKSPPKRTPSPPPPPPPTVSNGTATKKSEEVKEETVTPPTKPIERRTSRIFEAAEKFQNLLSPTEPKPIPDKPKKIIIPGVSVGGFKKEFERKASLTNTSPPKLKPTSPPVKKPEEKEPTPQPPPKKTEDTRKEMVRNAVNIISSALDKEGTRKSKSRPCMIRKPPVPFGVSGRSASGNIGMLTQPVQNSMGPKPFIKTPEVKKVEDQPELAQVEEDKTSSAEITLKSATLPRRKTTKAEIQLNYPVPQAAMEFKTEMAHNVQQQKQKPQRSEMVVPVGFRTPTVENVAKERIIPISVEKTESPPAKPPMPRVFQTQKSTTGSQRSNSLSRQSTQDSDTETIASSGEPIRKSPREYIIPIAVEGGGYVTPRAGSLEPSETASTTSAMTNKSRSKFGRARRMNSLFSDRDSEDEGTFSSLHRHSSFNKDSDTEDSRRDAFHILRSSRPKKSTLEHTDSVSSGEEDDDDGFEILTAENLFSTLLSRVRDLTQRLNVEDGGKPGFPSSRLLSHFDHGSNFFKRMDPLSRHSSLGRTFSHGSNSSAFGGTPWRRSASRDLASDIETVFNDPTSPIQRPRGDNISKNDENLNLADLDLKKLKLSDEDALALSYLTPGLSRRIQKQLLSQLAPSEARKLHRTLSSRNSDEVPELGRFVRRSVDRISSTLPRRFVTPKEEKEEVQQPPSRQTREFSVRSSSIGAEPRGNYKFSYSRQRNSSSTINSPDSSISESLSRNDDSISFSRKESESESFPRPISRYYSDSQNPSESNKTETNKKPSNINNTRKISRFLRPDFYDTPKEESIYLKEKKEREMETQKVLKEIRDKRKSRLNMRRERSVSKEKQPEETAIKEEEKLQQNDYVNVLNHDYVNVTPNPKKERISKLVRPKSYPTETITKEKTPEKESKISKLRKGFVRQSSKEKKDEKNDNNETEKSAPIHHKNKLLQSIEKKLEKFRSNSKEPENPDKKSSLDGTIKRLREQSLPRNLEQPCTESGLIKRAVSVEDLTITGNKPLQASRKSVTKILGLFKKYDETDSKKKINNTNNKTKRKSKQPDGDKNNSETVILINNISSNNNEPNGDSSQSLDDHSNNKSNGNSKKEQRPNSLLFNKMKHFQTNGTAETKIKSKLPVNSFRRSLNLDNLETSPPKTTVAPDRKSLKLDLTKIPVNNSNVNNNSATPEDSSSMFLSPNEDMSDTWSVCSSDYHMHDLCSPVSPNGHLYSGDENESVIDRIRRKSFYTRFNEKKRPRRASTARGYKDLDLYKDVKPANVNRSYDFRRSSFSPATASTSSFEETPKREYRPYGRSASLMNDYVNVASTNRYQTYSSKIGRSPLPSGTSLYSDSEDNVLDDILATARSRKYSPHSHQLSTRLIKTPTNEHNNNFLDNSSPSLFPSSSIHSRNANASGPI